MGQELSLGCCQGRPIKPAQTSQTEPLLDTHTVKPATKRTKSSRQAKSSNASKVRKGGERSKATERQPRPVAARRPRKRSVSNPPAIRAAGRSNANDQRSSQQVTNTSNRTMAGRSSNNLHSKMGWGANGVAAGISGVGRQGERDHDALSPPTTPRHTSILPRNKSSTSAPVRPSSRSMFPAPSPVGVAQAVGNRHRELLVHGSRFVQHSKKAWKLRKKLLHPVNSSQASATCLVSATPDLRALHVTLVSNRNNKHGHSQQGQSLVIDTADIMGVVGGLYGVSQSKVDRYFGMASPSPECCLTLLLCIPSGKESKKQGGASGSGSHGGSGGSRSTDKPAVMHLQASTKKDRMQWVYALEWLMQFHSDAAENTSLGLCVGLSLVRLIRGPMNAEVVPALSRCVVPPTQTKGEREEETHAQQLAVQVGMEPGGAGGQKAGAVRVDTQRERALRMLKVGQCFVRFPNAKTRKNKFKKQKWLSESKKPELTYVSCSDDLTVIRWGVPAVPASPRHSGGGGAARVVTWDKQVPAGNLMYVLTGSQCPLFGRAKWAVTLVMGKDASSVVDKTRTPTRGPSSPSQNRVVAQGLFKQNKRVTVLHLASHSHRVLSDWVQALHWLKERSSNVSAPFNVRKTMSLDADLQWRGAHHQFRIGQLVGTGGFAQVYTATHLSSGLVLAVKIFANNLNSSDRERIRKEINILKMVHHPNLVSYFGCLEVPASWDRRGAVEAAATPALAASPRRGGGREDTLWLLMEFANAGSLDDLLKRSQARLEEKHVSHIVRSVLLALRYLHDREIVHRDVKPANILLTHRGAVKLTDFGISEQDPRLDEDGTRQIMGSPQWMAPEAFFSTMKPTPQSDVWGLGITIVQMLTRRHPYAHLGGDFHAIARAVTADGEGPLLGRGVPCTPELRAFVSRSLVKNPLKRSTVSSLLQSAFISTHAPEGAINGGNGTNASPTTRKRPPLAVNISLTSGSPTSSLSRARERREPTPASSEVLGNSQPSTAGPSTPSPRGNSRTPRSRTTSSMGPLVQNGEQAEVKPSSSVQFLQSLLHLRKGSNNEQQQQQQQQKQQQLQDSDTSSTDRADSAEVAPGADKSFLTFIATGAYDVHTHDGNNRTALRSVSSQGQLQQMMQALPPKPPQYPRNVADALERESEAARTFKRSANDSNGEPHSVTYAGGYIVSPSGGVHGSSSRPSNAKKAGGGTPAVIVTTAAATQSSNHTAVSASWFAFDDDDDDDDYTDDGESYSDDDGPLMLDLGFSDDDDTDDDGSDESTDDSDNARPAMRLRVPQHGQDDSSDSSDSDSGGSGEGLNIRPPGLSLGLSPSNPQEQQQPQQPQPQSLQSQSLPSVPPPSVGSMSAASEQGSIGRLRSGATQASPSVKSPSVKSPGYSERMAAQVRKHSEMAAQAEKKDVQCHDAPSYVISRGGTVIAGGFAISKRGLRLPGESPSLPTVIPPGWEEEGEEEEDNESEAAPPSIPRPQSQQQQRKLSDPFRPPLSRPSSASRSTRRNSRASRAGSISSASTTATTPLTQGVEHSLSQSDLVDMGVEIGRGMNGPVKMAFHMPTLGRVALKTLGLHSKGSRHQLLHELKAYSELHSPFIVSFVGAFHDSVRSRVVLACEYLDLGSLQAYVEANGALKETALRCVLGQVTSALNFLHLRYQIHRDVKPDNLLMNHLGHVKLADFGLVTQLENTIAQTVTFLGTMAYLSPERITSKGYSYPSDVWSMGLIAIFCATAKHPFHKHTNDYWSLVSQITERAAPTLPPQPPDKAPWPEELHSWVASCLRRDPLRRSTAQELLAHPFLAPSLAAFYTARQLDGHRKGRMASGDGGNIPFREWIPPQTTESLARRARDLKKVVHILRKEAGVVDPINDPRTEYVMDHFGVSKREVVTAFAMAARNGKSSGGGDANSPSPRGGRYFYAGNAGERPHGPSPGSGSVTPAGASPNSGASPAMVPKVKPPFPTKKSQSLRTLGVSSRSQSDATHGRNKSWAIERTPAKGPVSRHASAADERRGHRQGSSSPGGSSSPLAMRSVPHTPTRSRATLATSESTSTVSSNNGSSSGSGGSGLGIGMTPSQKRAKAARAKQKLLQQRRSHRTLPSRLPSSKQKKKKGRNNAVGRGIMF